jgi:hypothetical protein
MAAQFCGGIVGDEQGIGGSGIWWCVKSSQFVGEYANLATANEFVGHQANRLWAFAWWGGEFKIHEHNFTKTKHLFFYASPRRRFITG